MRDFLKAFLLSVFAVPTFVGAGFCGIVGNTDGRYEVTNSMWAQEPYKKFVHLESHVYNFGGASISDHMQDCSAQYIAKNLILSAGHCVISSYDASDIISYNANNYKGESFSLTLLDSQYSGTDEGADWALFLVDDSKYYSDSFFNIKTPSANTEVINAGWGSVRILTDSELEQIRQLSKDIKDYGAEDYYAVLNSRMAAKGMKPLKETTKTLKASNCEIVFDNSRQLPHSKKFPDILGTTCNAWQGNSGGGYVSLDGSYLYGVAAFNYVGYIEFDETRYNNYMSSARQFIDTVQRYKNQYDTSLANTSSNVGRAAVARSGTNLRQTINRVTNNLKQKSGDALEQGIENSKARVSNLSGWIGKHISTWANASKDGQMAFLNNLVEQHVEKEKLEKLEQLQKAYEDAKSNEQSLANRTLTAASVAAMGIGGMELARGLAEQNADRNAEQSMDAYIATMRCKYGSNSVKAGTTEIELPGGNNANMMELRNEYFSLATDLKERKAALGMTPGIESETIMDKSEMGLYTQENVGITGGAYSSLYRAKVMESEKDKTQIDEEKSKTNNRVVGGGAATAVGGAGGVIGNAVINRK